MASSPQVIVSAVVTAKDVAGKPSQPASSGGINSSTCRI